MHRPIIVFLCGLLAACSSNSDYNSMAEMNVSAEDVVFTNDSAEMDMNAAANVDENVMWGNYAMADSVETDANAVAGNEATADGNATANLPAPVPGTTSSSRPDEGLGAFVKPPEVIRPERWYKFDFVVAVDKGALTTEADDEPTTAPKKVYVAPKMRVTLQKDENFNIKPLTDEVQTLGEAATWSWNVMPLRAGNFVLEAKVTPLIGPDPKSYTRKVPVNVTVDPWQKFVGGVEKGTTLGEKMEAFFKSWKGALVAFAGFLGALLLVLWRLGILKKKPEPDDPPPPSK